MTINPLEVEQLLSSGARELTIDERNALVEHVLPKIRSTAQNIWYRTGKLFDFDDLCQEAALGVLRDLENWDSKLSPFDYFIHICAKRRIYNWIKLDQHGLIDRKTHKVSKRYISLEWLMEQDSAASVAAKLFACPPCQFEDACSAMTREQLNTAIEDLNPMQQAVIRGLYVAEDDAFRSKMKCGHHHHNQAVKTLRYALTGSGQLPEDNRPARCSRSSLGSSTAEVLASIRPGVPLTYAQRKARNNLESWKPYQRKGVTPEQVGAVRSLSAGGLLPVQIAKQTGIELQAVANIVSGRTFGGERARELRKANEARRAAGIEAPPRALTREQALMVLRLHKEGHTCADIARQLDAKYTTIHSVVSGRSWKSLAEAA